jgi:predicted FMN-binding regulatory protein PaiB
MRVRTKIIEGHFHCDGDKTITKAIVYANSFDEYVLNIQEEFPEKKITRKSVITWKFLTVRDYNKLVKSEEYQQYIQSKQTSV